MFIIGVPVVFLVVVLNVQRRRRSLRPLRDAVESQDIVYRGGVRVKLGFDHGWSTKTLGGMELVVRSDAIQVRLVHPTLGRALGTEWLLLPHDTSIQLTRGPSHRIFRRDWIALYGTEGGKRVDLAVSADGQLTEIWNALIDAGARPGSSIPQT